MRAERFEVAPEDRRWMARHGWRTVDDVLACAGRDVAALSSSSDVLRIAIDPKLGGPKIVFLKRYLYAHRSQRIKQMFRGTLFGTSRARREYEVLREMRRREVPAVRPVAYGEHRRNAFLRAGFIVTEGAEGFRSLDLFALDRIQDGAFGRPERKAITPLLAATLRHMHDAGVRHGGLYWRNILVRARSDGTFAFELLDPDPHARLVPPPVPEADAIADLSEFVASGISLGLRGGLPEFMKAYFRVRQLSATQRHFTRRVLAGAKRQAPAEQRRIAVAETIEWLREHIGGDHRTFNSLDEFFEDLTSVRAAADHPPNARQTIHFTFSGDPNPIERNVVMQNGRATISAERESEPDLLVRSDPETWLAVVSGRPDAFARLRAGRLRVQGDTRLLPALVGLSTRHPSPDHRPEPRK